jgi:hypothetical protein
MEDLRRPPECHYDLIVLDLLTADLDGPLARGQEHAHPMVRSSRSASSVWTSDGSRRIPDMAWYR